MSYVECKVPQCGNPQFATGLCRKHYERERLATAVPCSFSGCSSRSFRGTLCEAHYREKLLKLRPLCTVPNCGGHQRNLTLGLCQKHEFRFRKHASVEQVRPPDWGSREAHPLYGVWTYHRRLPLSMVEEWRTDFWAFVHVVGERPNEHTLRKINTTKPLGPDNWYWKKSISVGTPAKYQQRWREENPERAKHHMLKRFYGITLEEYNALGEKQQWRCAICGGFETTRDKDGGPRKMPVDHCHKTGKVRALLCTQCNRGLGLFRDSPSRLEKAAAYLRQHGALE